MADPTRDTDADPADVGRESLAPPSLGLLDDPLGFIDADHARQRSACRLLARLAKERAIEQGLAHQLVAALTDDLAMHHLDEDEDLFPLLLKRAQAEDGLAPIIEQLGADHIAATASARSLVEALSALADKPLLKISRRSAELACTFASLEQRHLAIENAIVMVIARKRLKPADLAAMSRSMKARRGVVV